ncbi:hypothetical protein THRCLA_03871 [Thraustotheca clavata]|uniref:Transmembrane protein n=1 Tax=Thraustotheca clavata TaxID=74557 RepID=A0A1W0A0P6_9STRA|nr:hypothetical protein THRCLA_03871 [Thraustotheca clavata]
MMRRMTADDPSLWSPGQLAAWLNSYEDGRFASLVSQLCAMSGRQLVELSPELWARLQPQSLATSLRYTLLGMHQVASGVELDVIATPRSPYIGTMTPMDTGRDSNEMSLPKKKTVPVVFPPMFAKPNLIFSVFVFLLALGITLIFTVFKDDLDHTKYPATHVLAIISIPVISVAFTYVHIWAALFMTFYPLEYFGIWQFPGTNTGVCGWQGIVPFKGEKMARMSVRIMTTQLMDVKEVFGKIDPAEVAKELEPILFSTIKDIIESMALKYNPTLWAVLPQAVKDEIVEKVKEESPKHIESMMSEIRDRIEDVFDIEDMVVTNMMKDKQLIVNMFVTCGYKELAFIRNSGAYMGGIFGLIQMGLYLLFPRLSKYVVFPVFGLLVGTLTNWLALKMIFEPVEPKIICGIKFHGLFLRRQHEVASVYAQMVATDVLNSRNIIEAILKGPASDKLFELVYANVQTAVNAGASIADKIVTIGIGKDTYNSIKDDITDLVVQKFPESLRHIEDYTTKALDLETTLREKMSLLSYNQFERLLHPVFEEDEWKLVLMGGALGLALGFIQTLYEADNS